jgi:hypothetical protein
MNFIILSRFSEGSALKCASQQQIFMTVYIFKLNYKIFKNQYNNVNYDSFTNLQIKVCHLIAVVL